VVAQKSVAKAAAESGGRRDGEIALQDAVLLLLLLLMDDEVRENVVY
jgi:hypothetical protein